MIFLFIFLFSIQSFSQEAGDYTVEMLEKIDALNNPLKNRCLTTESDTKISFCERNHADYINNENNQLNFTNKTLIVTDPKTGKATKKKNGLFDMGFCWWHSRLTLNSAYVADFDNEDGFEIKNKEDARKIIRMIRRGEPVKIKNFKNLRDFSKKYEDTFRKELNKWMSSDTLKFKWANAFKGDARITNSELTKKIEKLKLEIDKNGPRFQSTQYDGVLNGSHAVIITKIEKETVLINHDGEMKSQIFYKMTAIDSNKKHTQSILFMPNTKQTTLNFGYYDADEAAQLTPETNKSYLDSFYQTIRHNLRNDVSEPFVPVAFNYVDREKNRLLETHKKICFKKPAP